MEQARGKLPLTIKTGNTFFWFAAACAFLPFLILPFLNHPSSDDYIYETLYRDLGFGGAQKKLYSEWIGRFTVTFIQITFVKFKLVTDHYFLHTIVLFSLTFGAALFALTRINRFVFNRPYPVGNLVQGALVFLLLSLYIYDDVASSFYWFSGAITYQLPVILFLILIGSMVQRFYDTSKKNSLYLDIINCIIIFLLAGCNETFAISTTLLMFSGTFMSMYMKSTLKKTFGLYLMVSLVSGLVILFSSGILVRQQMMASSTSYLTVVPIIALRIIAILSDIFKEPLFWVSTLIIFFVGVKNKSEKNFLSAHQIILGGMLVLVFMLAAVLTPLMLVTKGAYPPRAMNNLIFLATLFLFTIFFLAGRFSQSIAFYLAGYTFSHISLMVALFIVMLSAGRYVEAWKSVCSAYFYHQVMKDRERILSEAKVNNQHIVTLVPYNVALQEKIHRRFPNGTFSTLYNIILQKPSIIPFNNEAETNPSAIFLKYYNLEKIKLAN